MALNDLTGQNIQDTYQKVVQTDGTNLADGTGSALPISFNGNNVIISGSLTAQTYVVSESITAVTSGSTIFGNSNDDTHTFTGHITASGNISSSGDVIASNVYMPGGSRISFDDSLDGTDQFIKGEDNSIFIDGYDYIKLRADAEVRLQYNAGGVFASINPNAGHITASGDISSSGTITADTFVGIVDGGSF